MGYGGGWAPYVSVAERRKKAEKIAAKAKKAGAEFSPIAPYGGAMAKTFWGKAWGDNLERYSDYANRLPRGRTYVRNGSVIDLRISAGEVRAQVMGSSLYKVDVSVAAVPEKQWQAIGADCAGSIDSLVELLQGKLSKAVMERICKPGSGLFPAPNEIKFSCSCPDWASMCKHVAAVLYGVGARLDHQPELLFTLRRVDAKDLVTQAGAGLPKTTKGPKARKVLDDSALGDVFGIEMAEIALPVKPAARPGKATTAKTAASKVKPAAKTATTKPVATKTMVPKVKPPVKAATGAPESTGKSAAKDKAVHSTTASKPKAAVKRAK
ncbi:SWIM zinc finger family protein [Propionivibrio sp.]|uniref:SWIM zinc finger family protein n=1 Tax=Propionivibrio sp. TaxID=2212460 RepID=UPI003BF34871